MIERTQKFESNGVWFFLGGLPHDLTAAELSEYFQACGLDIQPGNISGAGARRDTQAVVVCVPNEVMADVVTWYLSESPLRGNKKLKFTPMKTCGSNGSR